VPARRLIASATTVAFLIAMPAGAHAATTITLSGSTSIAPLATQLAKGYVTGKRKGKVKFKILQGGSDVGINDVSHGRVTLGMASRDPQPSDPGGLSFNRIARDGVCISTHPSNNISNISQETVQDIFSGRITSWSQVPGARVSGPIGLVSRAPSSGTQDAFQNIFMGLNLRVAPSASQKPSNGRVQQAIRSDENAIGYLDFNFTEGTHAIPYRGVGCTLRNAKSGQYGGVRNFWLVSRGKTSGAAKSWINWVRKSGKARRIISKHWVPLR
jgi:phosphate transport system substrate-binding protein